MNNCKVYLSGSIIGSYRAQNIIKVLGDSHIPYFHFHGTDIGKNIKFKPLKVLLKTLWQLYIFIVKVPTLLYCTHVIILPMNFSFFTSMDLFFAKLFRKKIIADYYISVYDTHVNDRARISPKSRKAKQYLFRERYLLKSASKVIFLNNSEANYYQKVAGVKLSEDKVVIIPLCVDYRKEMFLQPNPKMGKDTFDVCWWGTYIPLHGLEKVIDAFKYIDDKSIRFHIFGNSEKNSLSYQERINQLNLQENIFIRNDATFNNNLLGDFLINHCDLAIGNFGDSDKAKTVLVNKLVDSISLGIPCITQETLATNEFFEDGKAIKYCNNDPKSIADGIVDLKNNQNQMVELKKYTTIEYLKYFSPDTFKMSLLNIL